MSLLAQCNQANSKNFIPRIKCMKSEMPVLSKVDFARDFMIRRVVAHFNVFFAFIINGVPLESLGVSIGWFKSAAAVFVISTGVFYCFKRSTWSSEGLDKTGFTVLLLFLIVGLLSFTWTIDSISTQLELVVWVYVAATAIVLIPFSLSYGFTVFVRVFFFLLVLSLVYGLSGGVVFMEHQGVLRFQGVFFGPHAYARPASLCLIILVAGIVQGKKTVCWLMGWAIAVGLVLTLSRQAYIATLLGVALVLFFKFKTSERGWILLSSSLVVLAFGVVLELLGALSGDVVSRGAGDDVTSFTGRTHIWSAAMQVVNESPLIGSGFGAGGSALQKVYSTAVSGWTTLNAHNGFLQAALDLGALGFLIFGVMLLVVIRKLIHSRQPYLLALFLSMLTVTLVERGIYGTGGMLFIIFIFLLLMSRLKFSRYDC